MTLTMLPPAPKDTGRLSDVFISALGAIIGGETNRLKLPRVESAVLVVVDGLGYENLANYSGHARNLWRLMQTQSSGVIRCGFPSTTAVSLTSLATGMSSGSHGILGYQVGDSNLAPLNMLNGWTDSEQALTWQPNETVAELAMKHGVSSHFVASPEYAATPFTAITLGHAKFHGHKDIDARLRHASQLAKEKNQIVYVYFAELDQAAHRFGVGSAPWIAVLEAIDANISQMSGKFGLLVTADHGIVDVPVSSHIYLNELPGFNEAVKLAVGDPRALFCYGDKSKAETTLAQISDDIYLTDFDELQRKGWVSGATCFGLVPDFVILARSNVAFYDLRTAKPQSLKMIGQHGSISDAEMRIPLIRGALFA